MAYALRYYKEIEQADGSAFRLEIYKKDSTAEAVEIGAVVQELSLEIQGSQGDVDSPIVKTSLSMTFVDAGDVEDGRKNGFWQEFYTPDALLWKVILQSKKAGDMAFSDMWGGYVTPDSFSESLVYRGSVNIIARDNIGHMQDFPFDAEGDADGMISLRNLIEAGWEKIESPMGLFMGYRNMLYCDGVLALDTLMNVAQFDGMDWYKAIESALASYGMVMRYVGENMVHVSSLRRMPFQGAANLDAIPQIEPVFISGAQRELIPAVRRIEESVDYEIGDHLFPKLPNTAFTGETEKFLTDGNSNDYIGIAWTIDRKTSGQGWCCPVNSMFFNALAYSFYNGNDADASHNFLVCNTYGLEGGVGIRYAEYSRIYNASNVVLNLSFGQPYDFNINGELVPYGSLVNITVAVIVEQNGISQYLQVDDTWGTEAVSRVLEFQNLSLNIPAGEFTGNILLKIQIHHIKTTGSGKGADYIPLYSASIAQSFSMLEKNTVNTVYNAENNVILSRSPEIGPAYDSVALPGIIKNGIFYRNGDNIRPAKAWGWSGSTPQQMAVYNHLQLLCYFAKPNNLISGTIVNADLTRMRAVYLWHGKNHLLVSGRYNFLTGHVDSAMLREFTWYDDMWGEVSESALPDTEQSGTTNVESGASSGGSSSTYTNTTTVNIGGSGGGASYLNDLLDVNTEAATAQSVLYYTGNEWVPRSLSVLLGDYATKASTLAGYGITDAYTKTEVDGKITTINGVLTTHDNRIKSLEDMWYIEDGVLKTRYPILSKGYAAGAVATVGEGGGGAILNKESIIAALGYTPYDSANPNGYITTSALSGYQLSSELGSLAYKSSLVASDIPDLSGKYLPLMGGTVSGPLTINTYSDRSLVLDEPTGEQYHIISFAAGGQEYAFLRANNLGTENRLEFNGNIVVHTGNIGSYKAGDSALLDGMSPTSYLRHGDQLTSNVDANELHGMTFHINTTGNGSGNENMPVSFGYLLNLCNSVASDAIYYKGVQISFGSGDVLQYRRHWNYAWQPWKTIAFTDSDITGYAAGLKHSNGTVAAEVNSNGSIAFSGNLNIGTKAICGVSAKPIIQQESAGRLFVGYGSSGLGYNTYICGNEVHLRYSKDSYTGLILNSSGNVTIGGSDLAGTSTKLYVNGDIKINGALTRGFQYAVDADIAGNLKFKTDGTDWKFHKHDGTTLIIVKGIGNVGIGTTSPAYKLDVAGTGRFSGAVTMSSTLTVGGDVTPSAAGTYNLGGNSARWKNIYANTVDTVNVDASGYVYAVGYIHSDEYISTDGYIKIGDATISYVNGVLKVDKPFMSKGYAAGATASVSSSGGGVILNKENIIDALGYTPYDAANPSNYTTRSAIFTGSASQFLKADGSVDSTAYLSTAGGTINGTLGVSSEYNFAITNNATGNWSGVRFRIAGANKGYLGVDSAGKPIYVPSDQSAMYTLLHSGNVGEYAVKVNPTNINLASDTNVAGYGQTADGWPVAGPALLLSNSVGNYAMMLSGRNGVLRFNTRENGTLTGWKTIAFTDSNVASATKLQTARTLWGRSFDGTANVDGNITLPLGSSLVNPSGQSAFMVDVNGYVQVGHGTVDKTTYINGQSVALRYGSSRTTGLTLASDGNVTVAKALSVATSVTSPYYKSSAEMYIQCKGGASGSNIYFSNNVFRPYAADNALIALGASDARWSTIYGVNGNFSGTLAVTGATTLANTLTARNIHPNADNTYNLGDTQLRWKNLYCNLVYATGLDADSLYIYNSIYSEGDIYSEDRIFAQSYIAADGDVRAGGFLETSSGVKISTMSLLYNEGAMSINASIEPASTLNYNLGTPTKLWAGIYSNSIQTNTIKIGGATITWDAANGVLKINKPIMATGYAAGATATAN